MRKGTLSSLVAVLSLATLPAFAADKGIYLGASVGESGVDVSSLDYNANATGSRSLRAGASSTGCRSRATISISEPARTMSWATKSRAVRMD